MSSSSSLWSYSSLFLLLLLPWLEEEQCWAEEWTDIIDVSSLREHVETLEPL